MEGHRNPKQQIQVKFFVDEKELATIKQRMMKSGTDNFMHHGLWRGLYQLSMVREVLSRKKCKSCDCPIRIFARNNSNGAQPISPKLLIEAGHVDTVITKDLLRLGRNSSLTGL